MTHQDHEGEGVAPQALLQQSGELAVAEGHVAALVHDGLDDSPQGQQATVDGGGLGLPRALRAAVEGGGGGWGIERVDDTLEKGSVLWAQTHTHRKQTYRHVHGTTL